MVNTPNHIYVVASTLNFTVSPCNPVSARQCNS